MALLPEPAPPPPRICVICTEQPDANQLVRPCRTCANDYCHECLREMFTGATADSTRMPPRCCTFLQLHTAGAALTKQEANDYRVKLDEWITLDKVYCPAPACSAFIPERLLPEVPTDGAKGTPTLQAVLAEIVKRISATPAARFFRGEQDIRMLPGYTAIVPNHIDLTSIQAHVEAGGYLTTNDLTRDMSLIVTNAKTYNKPGHPIANTADELYGQYLVELAAAMDRVISTPNSPSADTRMFACPKCHIGICTKCKQVEHSTAPCDNTAGDAILAMLETFRYKRCPLCKHAVRKMYGCSHIQCLCGAHFCYWCCQSINECDGGCEARDESDEDEDEDEDLSDDDETDEEINDDETDEEINDEDLIAGSGSTAQPANQKPTDDRPLPPHDSPQAQLTTHTLPTLPTRIVNLDAGGTRRWGARDDLDFGEEPEDEGRAQVWSCAHEFDVYYSKNDDGFNHGDEGRMECNRCFNRVAPTQKPPAAPPAKNAGPLKKRGGGLGRVASVHAPFSSPTRLASQQSEEAGVRPTVVAVGEQAWECCDCRLVVCVACREKYYNARRRERE
ncbi:hypothetical protein LTR85_004251 [Meristemomyces frigidus]|nr:hypothetical protein LTR85_004251 [Meristemomyces frigidus]